MRDLFNDNNSGYRLKTLQLFNWGVFDKRVETLSFDSKSTILTGLNGSGKTTTVDAILTLLIPYNLRFYNLSSESTKKRERDEENYTLGAIGSKATEEGNVKEYLRKKNEVISIINGIFFEPVKEKYLSLLQVRYFQSDELKCLKIISEKELLIEEIEAILAENDSKISQNSKWVKILSDKLSSRLFDSFTQYKKFFMERFGFRSDNALKLFGQTVGLKVLGDITSFIRQYMLDNKSPIAEYEALNTEFSNLTEIDRKIRQIKKQIELLSLTVDIGERYNEKKARLDSLTQSLSGLEGWYILHSLRLSEDEIKEAEDDIDNLSNLIKDNDSEQHSLNELIISLNRENKIAETIKEYERIIERLEIDEESKRKNFNQFISIVTRLKTLTNAISFENDIESFNKIQKNLPILKGKHENEIAFCENKREEIIKTISLLEIDIASIKSEISSLEKRNNNIPKNQIELREALSEGTGIKISSLPFLGELIRVKENSEKWEDSIERLLEPYSLSILVSPSLWDRVIEYLDRNELNDRISVIRTDELLILDENSNSSLLDKIEIKGDDNKYISWIKSFIKERENYVFSTSLDAFKKEEYSLLKNNLIKRDNIVLKDDSKDPFTKKRHRFLGWSNKKKIEELYVDLSNLEDEEYSEKETKKRYEIKIKESSNIIRDLDALLTFKSFDDIDVFSIKEKISDKRREKDEFIEKNPQYKDITKKIDELTIKLNELSNKRDEAFTLRAEKRIHLKDLNEIHNRVCQEKEKSENKIVIDYFVTQYSSLLKYDSLNSLKSLYEKLMVKIREERAIIEKDYYKLINDLTSSMKDFINPPSVIKPDISWRGEITDLVADVSYYSDFKAKYYELKDNDLSQYTDDFNNYLEQSLSNVIGTLSEALNSWDKEINGAIKILNKNLSIIPFDRERETHLRLEIKNTNDKDYLTFSRMLRDAIPDRLKLVNGTEEEKKSIYSKIKSFLDKYNNDINLKKKVLDLRNKYRFVVYEDTLENNIRIYSDTSSLSGGEKAKLTYTILASALCYQYGLDREDDNLNGPFRFVILDEAFSKSDSINSQYALSLFKELDLQLMVVTPRNGINLVEGYVSSLHLIEKIPNSNTSTICSMTISQYKDLDNGNE